MKQGKIRWYEKGNEASVAAYADGTIGLCGRVGTAELHAVLSHHMARGRRGGT